MLVTASISMVAFFWTGIKHLAWLLKVTSPKESSGLSFEKNIIIASLASSSLFPSLFEFKQPPIDPEISRIITEFNGLSSRSSPSLFPFVKIVRQSLTPESKRLASFWALAYPKQSSMGLTALLPIEYLSSLKQPSQVIWLSAGRDRSYGFCRAEENPLVLKLAKHAFIIINYVLSTCGQIYEVNLLYSDCCWRFLIEKGSQQKRPSQKQLPRLQVPTKLIYFNNKMKEADIDRIIAKYHNLPTKPPVEVHHTQKKQERRDRELTFMDDSFTPSRDKGREADSSMTDNYAILRQLDETEKKLAVSERNYAEMCRKYERARQMCEELSSELQREQRARLQELIDLQNKLHLHERENDKSKTLLEAKNHSIMLLEQKLRQKEEETKMFQSELEEISHRVSSTIQMKDNESMNIIQKELCLTQEETQRSLISAQEKYEKQITILRDRVDNFEQIILSKEKEKRSLLQSMEQMGRNHQVQRREIQETLKKNEEEYRQWLDQEKKEKLQIVEKYEQQIRELRSTFFLGKIKDTEATSEQASKKKIFARELSNQLSALQDEAKNYKMEAITLARADEQSLNKVKQLEAEIAHLKLKLADQSNETRQALKKLQQEQNRSDEERRKGIQLSSKAEQLRAKYDELVSENKLLQQENSSLKDTMSKELRSLVNVKKELTEATDSQLNINSTLTQTTLKMKNRIKQLQEELENTLTQLYAERLEKAKVQEDLEDAKIEMKKQYDLSIENTRRELQKQIKNATKVQQGSTEKEKEQLYLEMFKLERQYELLKSEVVTVDEMVRMGTKMSKFYLGRAKC